MQVHDKWQYRLLQTCFDLLALVIAWYATIEVRLLLNPFMSLQFGRGEMERLAPPLSGIVLLWIGVIPWLGAFRQNRDASAGSSLLHIARSAIVSSTLMIVVAFFSHQLGLDLSRSLALLFAPVSFVFLILARYAVLLTFAGMQHKWPSRERLAVLGEGEDARRMVELVRRAWNGAATVAGVILPQGATHEGLGNPVPVLGTTRELAEVINRVRLNRIIMVEGRLAQEEAEECARISKRMDVILSRAIIPSGVGARVGVTKLYGMHLLEVRPVSFTRRQEILKRAFDGTASVIGLVVLSPALLLLAALVRLTSPGPVLYKSARVGKGGRHFTFLKFRSMYHVALDRKDLANRNERSGHLFKIRDDHRVTPLGRFMRHYSLDELPQLLNVVRGEMSVVGPRPLPAEDLDPDGQSQTFAAWSEGRSRVLPGITGLWQISGRSDAPFERMLELDIEYIRNWSLALDLRILMETPLVVLTGKGAY